jgi:hypothetical protein
MARKGGKKTAGKRKTTKKTKSRSRSKTTKKKTKKAKKPAKKTKRKAKKVSVVGKKWQVWKGTRARTAGGLTKKDLRKSKSGKIVSKKQSDLARKRMKKGGISKWLKAVMRARKFLKLKGFVACKKGTAYYRKARHYYKGC